MATTTTVERSAADRLGRHGEARVGMDAGRRHRGEMEAADRQREQDGAAARASMRLGRPDGRRHGDRALSSDADRDRDAPTRSASQTKRPASFTADMPI